MPTWTSLLLDGSILTLALSGATLIGLKLLHSAGSAGVSTRAAPLALVLNSTAVARLMRPLRWNHGGALSREDRRILWAAAAVLTGSCVLTALLAIGAMTDSHRRAETAGLDARRDALVNGLSGDLLSWEEQIEALSRMPALRTFLLDDGQGLPRANATDLLTSVRMLNPVAYDLSDAAGQVLLRSGGVPAIAAALPMHGVGQVPAFIERETGSGDLLLQVTTPVHAGAALIGRLSIWTPLPAGTALIRALHKTLLGTHVYLCSSMGGAVLCLGDHAQEYRRFAPGDSEPEVSSTAGGQGWQLKRSGELGDVVSYAPVGDTGLGIVVRTPARTLFAPAVGAVQVVLLVTPFVIALGLLLIAWQVRPVVRELHQQRDIFRTAFDFSGIGIQLMDAKGNLLACNQALAQMVGYTVDEYLASGNVFKHLPDVERERAEANFTEMAEAAAGPYCVDRPYRHRDGRMRTLRLHVSPVTGHDGAVRMIAAFGTDATDVIDRQRKQTLQNAFFHAVLDNLHDAVYACNERGILIYANRAAVLAGIPGSAALTVAELATVRPLFTTELTPLQLTDAPLNRALRGDVVNEEDYAVRDRVDPKSWRHYQISAHPLRSELGQELGAAGVAHDVTAIRSAEKHLRWLLEHDEPTGLPNRRQALRQVTKRIAQTETHAERAALVVLDIDRFRHINDSYGHAFGDQLLRAVAKRLADYSARAGGTAFRIGGDQFAVLAPCSADDSEPVVARQALRQFGRAFEVGGRTLFVSATAGQACLPEDGQVADDLFARADVALNRAKLQSPGGAMRWKPDLARAGSERVELETELREALLHHQFVVYYQPKVCLETGRMTGAEALVRWNHPQHGVVSPATFIPILEETGLIVELGIEVLHKVCQQIGTWRSRGHRCVPVAVNCSARQLHGDSLIAQVSHALAAAEIPAELLELEITESMMLLDPDHVRRLVERLDALGVRTAIDDFGTGYSSLAVLKRLPVSALKLDREFVKDLPRDPEGLAISRAVLSMAQSLEIDVIAEGVETPEQIDILAKLGCAAYQGYAFAAPMPAREFEALLAAQGSGA